MYWHIKGNLFDPDNNYNYVEETKVSVSIKKNLCQQMDFKCDISIDLRNNYQRFIPNAGLLVDLNDC